MVVSRIFIGITSVNAYAACLESCRPRFEFVTKVLARRNFIGVERVSLKPRISRIPGRPSLLVFAMGSTDDAPAGASRHAQAQARVRAILNKSSEENKWDQCWKEGVTPWDLRAVTPVIQHLVDKGELPNGRALVPGCGGGYDVLALASDSRHVVGLDISETSTAAAQKIADTSPSGQWVQFVIADFFDYTPDTPFSLIFDYTFFCALNPDVRPAWAAKMAELLAPDGELITLIFPIDEHEGGPPFAVNIKAYQDVLYPHGFMMTYCEDNELAVGPRKGREQLARWSRQSSGSKI